MPLIFLNVCLKKLRRRCITTSTWFKLFKKLEGTEIWEVRTLYSGIAYRLLSFWDTEEDTLIVASNGFVKKTRKTKEIEKAESIRNDCFKNK